MIKITGYDIIQNMIDFWVKQGCIFIPSCSLPVGAATFHPILFFNLIRNKPCNLVYLQPSIRKCDGTYGLSGNRVIVHHQLQVIMSPAPSNFHELMLENLKYIGINSDIHSITEIDSTWESASLGASGKGWEVRVNSLEIMQFTYFQNFGHRKIQHLTGELAFGLERIMNALQNKPIMECIWHDKTTYGDLFFENEKQLTKYYLEESNFQKSDFYKYMDIAKNSEPAVAYENFILMNDIYNCLDAMNKLSYQEKKDMIKDMVSVVKSIE